MKACYAWDKKKFLNHKIYHGEGLAGQAWQEGDIVYLTEVPQSYIKITSGLGDANPTSVLIVPLKVNDQIFGVVEIASFSVFQDFEIEFVQKIAETIASTISTVKINARTQRLVGGISGNDRADASSGGGNAPEYGRTTGYTGRNAA